MASLNYICYAVHFSGTFARPICCAIFFLRKIRADTVSKLWSRKKVRVSCKLTPCLQAFSGPPLAGASGRIVSGSSEGMEPKERGP